MLESSCKLYEIGLGADIRYEVDFCTIYMPVGKMFKQVLESKYVQFFFQQVSPLGTYTFEIFNGIG